MEEVTVNTLYTFVSADGTDYSENRTYFSDADTEASRARRVRFLSNTAGAVVLDYATVPSSLSQLRGTGLLFLVNRDERSDMFVKLQGTGGAVEGRKLKAGEWLFLDVTDMDQQAFAAPISYSPQSISDVTARSEHADAKGEYLSIYKAAS
jgi:hypothetical protein